MSERSRRFRNLRIALLLGVLAFVGLGTLERGRRLKSWAAPLVVNVFPIAATDDEAVLAFVESLTLEELRPVERFFAREAERYDAPIFDPLQLQLAPALSERPPEVPETASALAAISFSLRLRWYGWRAPASVEAEPADLSVFLVLHPPTAGASLEHSVGLERGQVAVVHGFASSEMMSQNLVVIAHELLHLVGATDKYEPTTGTPVHPEGYAEPSREPLYPQDLAEIMGGRIPLGPEASKMPEDLRECLLGDATAAEIGWVPSM